MQTYYFNSQKKSCFWNSLSINFSLILFTILLYFDIVPIDFIAIKPENILQGKYLWTFISSMFMHAGFFHIFVNMFSLFFIGSFLEKIIGRKRFFLVYLISGLAGGVFFVLAGIMFNNDI